MKKIEITKADFKKWLNRKHPASRQFNYFDCRACAIASFLKEFHGVEKPYVGGWDFGHEDEAQSNDIPDWLVNLLFDANKNIGNERVTRLTDLRKALR